MSEQQYSSTPNEATKSRLHKKAHARYASMLLGGIGFLANVTAIAGLITSHAYVIIIAAAVLAILCGLYFFLKRWGKPVGWYTVLAVIILLAGSVMLSLSLQAQHATTSTISDNTSSDTATNAPVTSDGTPVSTSTHHSVVFEKAFVLTSQEGLELDNEQGTISQQQSDAKAPIDLYLSNYPMFSVSVQNFYSYQAPAQTTGNTDTDEYNACRNLIDTSQLGSSSISASEVTPGQKYCITTTRGRVALVTLQEMIDDGYNSSKNDVSFTVKLWN